MAANDWIPSAGNDSGDGWVPEADAPSVPGRSAPGADEQNQAPPPLVQNYFKQAKDAYLAGQFTIPQMVQSAKQWLASPEQYGPDNVREERNRSGLWEISVRTGPGSPWVPYGVSKAAVDLVLEKQNELLKNADLESGATIGARTEAGFKVSEAGKRGNLASRYGAENVWQLVDDGGEPTGNFLVREAPDQPFRAFDPEGLDVGDIFDFGADVVRTVPGIAGSVAGTVIGGRTPIGPIKGEMIGSALGDAAGELAAQGASALLPGEDDLSPAQRAALLGTNVLAGQVAGGAGAGARAAYRNIAPRTRILKGIASEELPTAAGQPMRTAADEARETVALEKQVADEIGRPLDMTVGMRSGSREAVAAEAYLGSNPGTRARQRTKVLGITEGLEDYSKRTIDRAFTGRNVDNVAVTETAAKTYDGLLRRLSDERAKATSAAYGEVAKASRNAKLVPVDRVVRTLDEWVNRTDFSTTKEKEVVKAYVERIRERLIERTGLPWSKLIAKNNPPPALTAREVDTLLSEWGAIAGKGDSAEQLLDRKKTAQITASALRALNEQVDAVIETGGLAAPVMEKLRAARQIYREASEDIESVHSDVMGSILRLSEKEQGELLPRRILQRTPAEIAKTIKILGRGDPVAAEDLQGAVLRELFSQARVKAGSDIPKPTVFGVNQVATLLSDAKGGKLAELEALFANRPEIVSRLRTLSRLARKVGDTAGMLGSPTETRMAQAMDMGGAGIDRVQQHVASAIASPWQSAATKGATLAMRAMMLIKTPEGMQRILNDSKTLDDLIKVMQPTTNLAPRETARILAHIAELQGTGPALDAVNIVNDRIAEMEQ